MPRLEKTARLEAEAAAMRAALVPLLRDYCELHDNPTKHELSMDVLGPHDGRLLAC